MRTHRFKLLIVTFGLIFSLVPISLRAQPRTASSPLHEVSSLTAADIVKQFEDLKNHKVYEGVGVSSEGKEQYASFWRGYEPSTVATLGSYAVKLQAAGATPEGQPEDAFYLGFFSGNDGTLSLRTSRSGAFSATGGIVLRGGERAVVPLSVARNKEQRMVVAALQPLQGDPVVLVCPREYKMREVGQGEPVRTLEDSNYRITAVQARVSEASLKGHVRGSGGQKGYAKGLITVSKLLAPSIESFDEITSPDVRIALEYRPKDYDPDHYVGVEASEAEIPLSVRSTLLLQNGAGYQRIQEVEDTIRITKISLSQDRTLELSSGGIAGEGECYMVVRRRTNKELYLAQKGS
jgi:hypothetical protein